MTQELELVSGAQAAARATEQLNCLTGLKTESVSEIRFEDGTGW